MLVSKAEIKKVLGIKDNIAAIYLRPFDMEIIAKIYFYDVNKDFLLKLKRVIIDCLYEHYYAGDAWVHRNALEIVNQLLLEYQNPVGEFAITSEDIRDLFNLTLDKCEQLLSVGLSKYQIRRLPKTYNCTKEFLDRLSDKAEGLGINLNPAIEQLYRLVTPNTMISHKTHSWTKDMLMCKERNCECKGCFFEDFFTPYDPNFSLAYQSPKVCNIKGYVKYAMDNKIPESRTSSNDDFIEENE